ncbi:MAG: sugar ABC transporter permease [Acidimicrobiales bacterium]
MVLAYLLDKNLRGSRIYQSMFYTPVVLSLAVVGFIWQSVVYSTENGLATSLFGSGGNVNWLGNQEFLIGFSENYGISKNFVAILVAIAWRHSGYIMVLYLAGMKSVDQSLRESAAIDGCNEWQAFRHVLFPTLKPINVVVASSRSSRRCVPSTSSMCSTPHDAHRCCRSSPRTTCWARGAATSVVVRRMPCCCSCSASAS